MRLLRSERGALGPFALCAVLVATALVYALYGTVEVLLEKEAMQDAADAAAFASAVMNARGMNLLAFLNLVMAALVAVLIALRLAQALFVILAAILTGLAWVTFGATLPLAALATQQAVTMQEAFTHAKSVVFPALEVLHTTERAVSVVVPWVAATDALVGTVRDYPNVEAAFALPTSPRLPAEPDEFPVLCEHGAEMVVSLVFLPIEPIIPEDFLGSLRGAAGDLARSLSGFLCGDGSGEAPSHREKMEQGLPRPSGADSCDTDPASAHCVRAQRTLRRAAPHPTTGACQDEPTCDFADPYESAAREAREACNRSAKEFTWQEQDVSVRYVRSGGAWRESEHTVERSRLVTNERRPCGPGGSVGREWNTDSGPEGPGYPLPLCTSEIGTTLPTLASEGSSRTIERTDVSRIFSCLVEVERDFPLASEEDAFGGQGASTRSPHRVEEGLLLGDEAFQIRAVVVGAPPVPRRARGYVELATRTATNEDSASAGLDSALRSLGGMSVAQAEYYFDHTGDVEPAEWLWDLRWTARLRRFRLPDSTTSSREAERRARARDATSSDRAQFGGRSETSTPNDACREAGARGCDSVDTKLGTFDALVIH